MKIRILLLTGMLVAAMAVQATDMTIDGITYTVLDKGVAIVVSCADGVKNADIKASVSYEGKVCPVTSIGESAFYDCFGLTSVTIPGSVTTIGDWAFRGCSGLTSITIPGSVTSIGGDAFSYCSGLTSVTIPGSVTSIGDGAFRGCSGLISVTIPGSVTSIGSEAFQNCLKLSFIEVSSNSKFYSSLDGVLFDKEQTRLITFPAGKKSSSYIIPGSVTSIGSGAFSYCSGLTSVSIPGSVTSIGVGAFWGCSSLTSVSIPGSVTSIGSEAFRGCSGLTSVSIPGSVTSIGDGAFRGCSGLTSVTISGSVISIGAWAFSDCSGLTSVTIPGSVTSIGDGAFGGCSSLTSVSIPGSVTSIGMYAFYSCVGLEHIYCMAVTPPLIDRYAFDNYDVPLHVPVDTKAAYQSAVGWENFTNIIEDDFSSVDSELAKPSVTYHAGILSLPDNNAPATVYVYTQDGKCVWTCPMAVGERTCDLSSLTPGIYLVRVKAGNEISCLKIVR